MIAPSLKSMGLKGSSDRVVVCATALSVPWYLQGRCLLGEDEMGSHLLEARQD